MLVVGGIVATAVNLTRGDIAYMLVILWAFVGIAVKHTETPVVATGAWVVTVLAALVLVIGIFLRRGQKQQPAT